MGYTSNFYLTDPTKLSEAVGSKDNSLVARIHRKITELEGPSSPPDLKILVTLDGEIFLNGKCVTSEELNAELAKPENAGRGVSYFKRDSKNAEEGRRKSSSPFPSEAKFVQYLREAIHNSGVRYSFLSSFSTEESFQMDSGDELALETAVAQLISDSIDTSTQYAHQYGYALEYVCREICCATLSIDGKRRLSHLKVKSRLFKHRCPIPLPEFDDFPEIGYLASDEAQTELQSVLSPDNLVTIPLEFVQSRDSLISYVKRAANEKLTLVGFYY